MSILLLPAVSGTRDFTKFDAYLDTQGLVFAAGEGLEPQTSLLPLRPTRQDTGQNPWELRPESGDIFGQGDWWLGMGQEKFHAPGQDRYRRYLWSRGIDISKPGRITNRKAWAESDSTKAYTAFAQAGSALFGVGTDGNIYKTTDLTTWSDDSPTAGFIPFSVTSSGSEIYAIGSDGAGGPGQIWVRSAAGSWTQFYGDAAATTPELGKWLKDRLIWFDSEGDDLYEQVTSGTANATVIDSFQSGWDAQAIFEAGAYIYAVMYNASQKRAIVYHYGLNADASAIERKGQTNFPTGLSLFSGVGYVGAVFLGGAISDTENTVRPVFLRAEPNEDGFLSYLKEAEGFNGNSAASPQLRVDSMFASETEVLMSWRTDGTDDKLNGTATAVGIYDFARGAFSLSSRVAATAAASTQSAVTKFMGRIVYSNTALSKTYAESATVAETTAALVSSVADWHNAGIKHWTQGELACRPLPAGSSIKVYTTSKNPEDQDWTLAVTYDTLNGEGTTFDLDVESRIFAYQVETTRATDTTLAPVLLNLSFRSYPKPSSPEWRLTRYVRIMDLDAKDAYGEEIRQNPETVREWLLDKAYEPVTLYEAGATWDVRIVDIGDVEPGQSVYSQTGGDPNRDAYVMRLVFEGTRS